MSRSEARIAALVATGACALLVAVPGARGQAVGPPAPAQPAASMQGPPDPATQAPSRSRTAVDRRGGSSASSRPTRCRKGSGDEIVVCAPDDGSDQRIESTAESDPNSREAQRALNDGVPHVDLRPKYPGPVVARGCFLPPCPPPPAYLIDVTKLPPPPAGSDAEKVANGEKRGD